MSIEKLYGVGINDADYFVSRNEKIKGEWIQVWKCPYYSRWKDMLYRCYSETYQKKYHSYRGCSVCEEWHLFSNFKSWMETQDWEGKCLDKDLLVYKNKIYSPETCIFIDNSTNTLLLTSERSRGDLPIGVRYTNKTKGMINERTKPFSAQITDRRGDKPKYKHLGYYKTPKEAHRAWQKAKCKLILDIIQLYKYKETSSEYKVLILAYNRILDNFNKGDYTL